MNPTFRLLGRSELLPRYIFLENLLVRRRVLELGAVASTQGESARFLRLRGARQVVACDADLSAVEQAQHRFSEEGLRYRADILEDLEVGGFDLVLVADLAPYVLRPEKLAEVALRVARGGHLVGALRNPSGLSLAQLMEVEARDSLPTYGQLLDVLAPHFPSIQVATQSPLLGYQLALDTSEGLEVDGSLLGSVEASYYVVLAGAEPVEPPGTTWVQLAPEPLAYTAGKLDESFHRTRAWEERSQKLKELLEQLRADLSRKDNLYQDAIEERERLREEVAQLASQLSSGARGPGSERERERERDEWAARQKRQEEEISTLRVRLEEAGAAGALLRAELETLRRSQQEATAQTLAAQELARQDRSRRQEVSAQLEETRGKLLEAQAEARGAQDRLTLARAELERLRRELPAPPPGGEGVPPSAEGLVQARERELALADQRSQALLEVEALKVEREALQAKLVLLEEQRLAEAQERARLERVAQSDATAAREAREALLREKEAFSRALLDRETEIHGLGTELSWARAEVQRLQESQGQALAGTASQASEVPLPSKEEGGNP